MVSETIKSLKIMANSGPLSQYNEGKVVKNEICPTTLLVYSPPRRSDELDQRYDENNEEAIRMVQDEVRIVMQSDGKVLILRVSIKEQSIRLKDSERRAVEDDEKNMRGTERKIQKCIHLERTLYPQQQ